MSSIGEGFVWPNYMQDVDFDAHVAATPNNATIKGMFFADVIDGIRNSAGDRVATITFAKKRYLPFSDYPSRDFFRLLQEACALVYPSLPTAEAVRRLGWGAFPRFVDSMVGRVVVGIFLDDIDRLLSSMAKAWRYTSSIGTMTAEKIGPSEWRCEVRDFPGAIVPYYAGCTEGILRHYDLTPEVLVRRLSVGSFDLAVNWKD